jgi:hypothetical protein
MTRMNVLDRLLALDGARVAVAILRAKDLRGLPVRRNGTLRVTADVRHGVASHRDMPVAHVVDADELPIATLAGVDALSLAGEGVRCDVRPSLRIEVGADAGDAAASGDDAFDYERATRDIAAELEAGFRAALRFRPDPAPDASVRARYGVPPIEDGPLSDASVRFAVAHASVTLRPDGPAALTLTCIESSIRHNRQFAAFFEPLRGVRYVLDGAEIERLTADVRAFLANHRERFIARS